MAKPHFSPCLPLTIQRKPLVWLLSVSFLCSLSYFLGSYKNSKSLIQTPNSTPNCPEFNLSNTSTSSTPLDFEPHHTASLHESIDLSPLEFCPKNYTDYCPCQDPFRERKFNNGKVFRRERHCPERDEIVRCLIPRPIGYKTPFSWPKSRDFAWFANVPYNRLTVSKAIQNWVRLEGDLLVFPGGGTSFINGVKGYVGEIGKVIPLMTGEIRTVLDIGCGVASFGARLMDLNILTMSMAPRDIHEAQVQFALERGLPAMLGVLSTYRLQFPSRSFDMAHCSRCLVQWAGYDGVYLMEIDRVLRPGGYFVLSGPPISWRTNYKGWERRPQDLQTEQDAIENLARRLCWKKIAERGPFAVWRKPTNHVHCIRKSKILQSPPFCEAIDPDAAWYKKMEACITPLPRAEGIKEIAGGAVRKFPKRLSTAPPRIVRGSVEGITAEIFNQDNHLWDRRLSHYTSVLSSFNAGKYRNIMDMNAELGGFAAALSKYPVWVMNVVPSDSKNNTLGMIYERGLIGTYMDWCEAFSTYPRTYDLIHSNGILSMYMDKCDILDIFLEMDRILRPEGAIIIRDHVDVIVKAKRVADRMRWHSWISHSEHGPFHPEKILFVDNSVKV
ncbi:S-adenosyl-L-methionine-dependent methyltransferases superfamily protein isoform X2 [Tasmannia lanceolata]|uniref:S-adenosyl-L-methionine-dependent methyltransferases superfamily protein isoform X2 n=1 Tax=Tasmannia lanceolata TaxID=3420 RepID=UPI0040643D0A